jgi:quercetin dioxygenase-like cupin family protein
MSSPESIYVPADGGTTKWFNGDILTTKLTAGQSGGALSLTEATVPPGGGPAPHIHPHTDEIFYLVGGELELLRGEGVTTISTGDLVFLPRGITHRYINTGSQPARMLILYTRAVPKACSPKAATSRYPVYRCSPWDPSASTNGC